MYLMIFPTTVMAEAISLSTELCISSSGTFTDPTLSNGPPLLPPLHSQPFPKCKWNETWDFKMNWFPHFRICTRPRTWIGLWRFLLLLHKCDTRDFSSDITSFGPTTLFSLYSFKSLIPIFSKYYY